MLKTLQEFLEILKKWNTYFKVWLKGQINELADAVDNILDIYGETGMTPSRRENGRKAFIIERSNVVHYEILGPYDKKNIVKDIESITNGTDFLQYPTDSAQKGDYTLVLISELAQKKITPEAISHIKVNLEFSQ